MSASTSDGATGGLRLLAPAKINLALEVLDKRGDGFHEIDTVMTTIDLADRVRLQPADELSVRFDGPHGGMIEDDLCTRAALALGEASGHNAAVRIEVTKQIPLAAGLGGGSSDAAAVLRGLNQLWGLGWTVEELSSVAASLGSDVPFFLQGGAARCSGRGEIVEPLRDVRDLRLLLLLPPVTSAPDKTARRYGALTADDFSDGEHVRRVAGRVGRGAPPPVNDLVNTFEGVVERSEPELLAHYASYRKSGVPQIHLCGSGPMVYLLVSDLAKVKALRHDFEMLGADVIDTRTLGHRDAVAIQSDA